jgi:hypothetical protein
MKTYRNHRNRTGRHKRYVKHRVQTRINHKKRRTISGRRHKFFKRGGWGEGEQPIDRTIKTLVDGVQNTVKRNIDLNSNDTFELGVKQFIEPSSSSIELHNPTEFTIDDKTIKFVIVKPNLKSNMHSVYIYLNDKLYGNVTIIINNTNMDSYDKDYARFIFNAINLKPDYEDYKKKQ